MAVTYAKIVNNFGYEFSFSKTDRLYEDIDFSGLSAYISATESSGNGSFYQGTKLEDRYFDINFRVMKNGDDNWMQEHKKQLFSILSPTANPMTLYFTTNNGGEFYINIELEEVPSMPTDFKNNNAAFQVGIIKCRATDPLIYNTYAKNAEVAFYEPKLEFALDIPDGEGGIEFGARSDAQIVNLYNDSSESVGMLVKFRALTTVENPSIMNTSTYEQIKINFTMLPGDVIEINTVRGKRSVILVRDNVRTNIFNRYDFQNSKFYMLYPGDNLLRYDADDGVDGLNVSVSFREVRVGV